MAPKYKFTKEQMTDAAVRVIIKGGMESLTAKSVAKELGISTQPIFTCFGTMENLKKEAVLAAEGIFDRYVRKGLSETVPFFGYGMQYISFAKEQPELYRLLFLSTSKTASETMATVYRSLSAVRPSLMAIYKMNGNEADRYFTDMWLVVHSLATLIVTGRCPYSDGEIGRVLTELSLSVCKAIKEIPGFADGDFDRDGEFEKLMK